jgi:Tol biopolymer transport system component
MKRSASPARSPMPWKPENTLNGEDIWLLELARGGSTRLTLGPGTILAPIWSPDGSRIAFDRSLDGLYVKAASGAGKEELMLKSSGPVYPDDWSRDGRFLLYSAFDPKTGYDLWVLPDPMPDPGSAHGERKPILFLR